MKMQYSKEDHPNIHAETGRNRNALTERVGFLSLRHRLIPLVSSRIEKTILLTYTLITEGGAYLIIVTEQGNNLEIEIVIRCANPNSEEVTRLKQFLETMNEKVLVTKDCSQAFVETGNIIYCEYVNRKVFVYTADDMFTTALSLTELQAQCKPLFRCSKNTIINIKKLDKLKSEISGSILATLSSGEKVMISRHYASKLRELIKER